MGGDGLYLLYLFDNLFLIYLLCSIITLLGYILVLSVTNEFHFAILKSVSHSSMQTLHMYLMCVDLSHLPGTSFSVFLLRLTVFTSADIAASQTSSAMLLAFLLLN